MIWRGWEWLAAGLSILRFVGRFVKLTHLIFVIFIGFAKKSQRAYLDPFRSFRFFFPRPPFLPSLSPSAQTGFLAFWRI